MVISNNGYSINSNSNNGNSNSNSSRYQLVIRY